MSHAISCDSTDSGHASICEVTNWPASDRRSYPPPPGDNNAFCIASRRFGMMQMIGGPHRPNPYLMIGGNNNHQSSRKPRAPPPPTMSMPGVQFVPGVGKYVNVQQAARRRNSSTMGVIVENGCAYGSDAEQVSRV